MWTDEFLKKIHLLSEEYSRSFNHNLKAIFVDLQKIKPKAVEKL